jgi:hypothetical protein
MLEPKQAIIRAANAHDLPISIVDNKTVKVAVSDTKQQIAFINQFNKTVFSAGRHNLTKKEDGFYFHF